MLVFPNFTLAELQWKGEAPQSLRWPFVVASVPPETGTFTLRQDLGFLHPHSFGVLVDDVLLGAEVNGSEVDPALFPIILNPLHPARLDLGDTLRPGSNEIVLIVGNIRDGSRVRIHTHPLDPLCIVWTVLCIAAFGSMFLLLARLSSFSGAAAWIIFGGCTVRILYWVATPYYQRSHDLGGHVEYLKYFAQHLALPAPNHGWETHQPPLYYILGGLWMRLTAQESSSWLYGQWSLLALVLSLGSMLIGGLIGRRLFTSEANAAALYLFLAILACFPALIFQAARVSNDVLFAFISFLWLWLLLRWWDAPSARRWAVLAAVVGVSFVIKNGALVLAAITALCAVIRVPRTLPVIRMGLILTAAVLLFAGWYQVPRALTAGDPSTFIVGKFHLLPDSLRIPARPLDFMTFLPGEVLRMPFNHTYLDEYRRAYFPEFFFKSALFGEWPWGDHLLLHGRMLAVAGMGMLLLIPIGIWMLAASRHEHSIPLLITMAGIIAAQILYVVREPFACNLDFRYFVILTVPIAAFAAAGASRLGAPGTTAAVFFFVSAISFLAPLLYI